MSRPNPFVWHLAHVILFVSFRAFHRVTEVVTDKSLAGPSIWFAKHCSYWDIALIGSVCWRKAGERPWFEMASFYGYPVLGQLRIILKWCGGFEVMRPKDLLRMKHAAKKSREEAREAMKEVNDEAAVKRAEILRAGAVYCFFPEGTREINRVRPFRILHEIDEARDQAVSENLPITVVPLISHFGEKPRFPIPFFRRRPVSVRIYDPIAVADEDPKELTDRLEAQFKRAYEPPEE